MCNSINENKEVETKDKNPDQYLAMHNVGQQKYEASKG